MKRNVMQLFMALSVAALPAGLARAADTSATSKEEKTATEQTSSGAPSEVRLSKLMDANIQSKSGEDLGKLEDLLVNPQTGKITFAVVGRGGILGIGEKLVPVPWQAVSIQSEKQFTLNVDKQKLQSAPTIDKSFSDLQKPDYMVTIYRFYAIPSTAVGGAETPGGTEQGPEKSSTEQP